MSRAVVPRAIPPLPRGKTEWARSLKRAGGVFHAHALGVTACGKLALDRHKSTAARGLGDFQFWGACPRCFALALGDEFAAIRAAHFGRERADFARAYGALEREIVKRTRALEAGQGGVRDLELAEMALERQRIAHFDAWEIPARIQDIRSRHIERVALLDPTAGRELAELCLVRPGGKLAEQEIDR